MTALSLAGACAPSTFSGITLWGSEVLTLEASMVTNYSISFPYAYRFTAPSRDVQNATFCNVTVTYTHPGANDSINVEAWLPTENWNGRFQAVGGGGWVAGRFSLSYGPMAGAVDEGYATITTDAGLGSAADAAPWALLSPGNVDLYKLQNLASVSLNDKAILGKSLIEKFYGVGPSYSYWNGCSQGGRQGLMLAQRYPNAYDGLAIGAPASYWSELLASMFWPQQYMNMIGEYPYGCELDAITAAAISECDGLDGAVDAIISDVEGCRARFDPFKLVGTTIVCPQTANNSTIQISTAAASVANATWSGAVSETGKQLANGLNIGADLTGNSPRNVRQTGIVETNCTGGESCVGAPIILGTQWLSLFLAKDPTFDFAHLTHKQFERFVHAGRQQYASIIDAGDPDLSEFRETGGKILAWHGLADEVIPTKNSERYYDEVSALVPDIDSFYRYFPVPGLGHCWGGNGGQPTQLFAQLRAWVENGTAPESSRVSFNSSLDGKTQERLLCPYPRTAQFDAGCGDAAKLECWSCSGVLPEGKWKSLTEL
ncbi:Tannase/feruloyl esterase [Biscogniauxia marginata]|nr:Tannase/feruloyl esterase [Biscogniauxia marginata]